jgi:aspartate aminotransferase-like enzyme
LREGEAFIVAGSETVALEMGIANIFELGDKVLLKASTRY